MDAAISAPSFSRRSFLPSEFSLHNTVRAPTTKVRVPAHLPEIQLNVLRHHTANANNSRFRRTFLFIDNTNALRALIDRLETRELTLRTKNEKNTNKNKQRISLIQERVHFPFKANLLSHCVCSSSFIRFALSCVYLRARVHSPVPTESLQVITNEANTFRANRRKHFLFFILSLLILAPNTFDTLRLTNFFTGNISFCFIFAACDARA